MTNGLAGVAEVIGAEVFVAIWAVGVLRPPDTQAVSRISGRRMMNNRRCTDNSPYKDVGILPENKLTSRQTLQPNNIKCHLLADEFVI
jgi:hypothetical protein